MIALLVRDLRLALRTGGGFGLSLVFFLIVIVLVPFGVGPNVALLSQVAIGIIWVGALLSCLLSLDRIFALDYEDGTIELLAIAPIPLEGVVVMKSLAHWITTGLPLAMVSPILAGLLGLESHGYKWLIISLLIGTPALSIIGGFGAALIMGIKRGGLLLSLLVLPLYIPTLILGADLARRGFLGMDTDPALFLLAGLSAAVFAFMPFASAIVLRINLR